MGYTELVRLLRPFTSVQTLCAYVGLVGHMTLVLKDIAGEMVAEVLPALDLPFLEDQPASSVAEFCAARRLSGRPVTVIGSRRE